MKPPWTKHSQAAYKRLAANQAAPPYLRVAWYAMGHHRANGHAEFKRSELALLLGKQDKRFRRVDEAILTAIEYGLLDQRSTNRCLVVPGDLIEGPLPGNAGAPCATHGTGAINKRAKCHPNRKHHAQDLCNPCYQAERRRAKIIAERANDVSTPV